MLESCLLTGITSSYAVLHSIILITRIAQRMEGVTRHGTQIPLEVLAEILQHSPVVEVFCAQRIHPSFQETISAFPTLQQRLFLRPDPKISSWTFRCSMNNKTVDFSWEDEPCEKPPYMPIEPNDVCKLSSFYNILFRRPPSLCLDERLDERLDSQNEYTKLGWKLRKALGSHCAACSVYANAVFENILIPVTAVETFKLASQNHTVLDMYITQPPIKKVGIVCAAGLACDSVVMTVELECPPSNQPPSKKQNFADA